MDLPTIGMHQDRVAMSAGLIDRVIAGDQNGWGANDRANCRGRNNLQLDLWVQVGAQPLSVTDACAELLTVMS